MKGSKAGRNKGRKKGRKERKKEIRKERKKTPLCWNQLQSSIKKTTT
jgi:hypothetical protein